jgi:hypothetical protein
MTEFWKWFRSIWSEPDGTGSSIRIIVTSIVAFVLVVGGGFALSVHHHSLTIEQFDGFLAAAGTFIVTTAPVLYGINKASDWAKDRNANGQGEHDDNRPVPRA